MHFYSTTKAIILLQLWTTWNVPAKFQAVHRAGTTAITTYDASGHFNHTSFRFFLLLIAKSLFDFFVLSRFLSRFLSTHFLLAQQVVFVIFLNRTTQNFDIPEGTAVVFVAPSHNRSYSVCSGVRGTVGQSPRGDGLYYSGQMRPMDKFWYVFNQKGTYFFFDCLSPPNQDIGGSFRVSPPSKFVCVWFNY